MPVRPPGAFFLYMKTLDRGEANLIVSKILIIETIYFCA
jgi:hypothetical protein